MIFEPRTFVNREPSIGHFQRLLDHPKQRLLLLHGQRGIGKSYLLHHLLHLAKSEGRSVALIDLADPRLYGEEELRDKISMALGATFSANYMRAKADLAASATALAPAWLNTSSQNEIKIAGDVSTGGDFVAGDKFTLNNSSITINGPAPRHHEPMLDGQMQQLLCRHLKEQPTILLFDHLTKERGQQANRAVARWLRHSLLEWYLATPEQLSNLRLIFAGRQLPFIDDVADWVGWAKSVPIGALADDAMTEYIINRRRLDQAHLATMMLASGGNPGMLFLMANNLEQNGGAT